jgi:hypothetical protein
MKKVLLLLFMSLSLIMTAQKSTEKQLTSVGTTLNKGIENVYSDGKAGVSTVYSDGKEAIKYLTPKTEKFLDKISKKLETTTDKLWDILVRQQKVWSWCYLIGFILSTISWINFYRLFQKSNTELEGDGTWTVQNILLTLSVFTISCILSVFSAIHLIPMMTGFMNPEFGALETIGEIAKSLK